MFSEILDGDVYKYYAEGEWKRSSSGKSVAIINPTTRKTQYKVQGDHLALFWTREKFLVHVFFARTENLSLSFGVF